MGDKKHKFGKLIIPKDVQVVDNACVRSDKHQADECRLPGSETDGEEEDEE